MAKTKTVYETEEQYDERVAAECDAKIYEEMSSPWFKAIKRFFQGKVDQAKKDGDIALAEFWVNNGNEFFEGQLTYVCLGYKGAKEAQEKGHTDCILPADESRKITVDAKARIKKYQQIVDGDEGL